MKLLKFRAQRLVPVVLAALVVGVVGQTTATAQWKWPNRKQKQGERYVPAWEDDRPAVMLNYGWVPMAKVLHDVAERSDSLLVPHDLPTGYFSRRDRTLYSRTDAVNMLNRRLEQDGYRILTSGQFMTVMKINRARAGYLRPIAPPNAAALAGTDSVGAVGEDVTPAPKLVRKFDRIVPAPRETDAVAERSLPVTAVSHESSDTDRLPAVTPQPRARLSASTRDATGIAGRLYRSLKDRAEIDESTAGGVSVIRIFEQSDRSSQEVHLLLDPPVLVQLEVDAERQQLLIEGRRDVAESVHRAVRLMDDSSDQHVRLIAAEQRTAEIGRTLGRQLTQLQQAAGADAAREPLGPFAQAQPQDVPVIPPVPANVDDPNGPAAEPTEDLPTLLGTLKGDVTIESIPGLDLMILRGNEADVAQVMEVIRSIERLSVGTTPDIHLLRLQHVNSEALAELLTDVYSQLADLQDTSGDGRAQVIVIPVGRPNAVLVLAPEALMESILKLAEELDQPIDAAAEVEVFWLKNAVASQVVTMLEEFYEERGGLGTRLNVTADFRTNTVVVQARPADLSEIASIIRKIDRDQAKAVAQLRVFPLRNAIAGELAEFLNQALQNAVNPAASGDLTGAITAAAQGAQQLRDPKSIVWEFLAGDDEAQDLLRSGLLVDIRITGDPRTNSLLVTAPKESLSLIARLIELLDMPTNLVAEIKVFQLENADAEAAAELLRELFAEDSTDENALGIQLAGAEDASSSLVPLRFSTDTRTNSVVAVGGGEAMRIVEAILLRLDQSDLRERRTEVIRLRNSPAVAVAAAINLFLEEQRELATLDPGRISTSNLLEQEIIVTPEEITNNLIISATPRYFEEVQALARELDREPDQVVIQALLVEVELNETDELGVELGFQDDVLFDRSVIDNLVTITETVSNPATGIATTTQRIISQEGTPGFAFNNNPLGNNTAIVPSQVGEQGLTNFSLGRVNSELGFGGLVLSASSNSVSVLIRALAARRNVRILSRPQILALDNQTAEIQVGQQVPIVDGVNITATGAAFPLIRQDEAGIILTVVPRISPEGKIVMELVAEKSQFQATGVELFTDASTGNTITSPIKDVSAARTSIKVPDGQTVVVGGMITKTDDRLERKVPFLGDIPILGRAFRYDGIDSRRTELLIFLTPRIVHNDATSEHIKRVEAERLHFFLNEAEAVHGPLFGVPLPGGGVGAPPLGTSGSANGERNGENCPVEPGPSPMTQPGFGQVPPGAMEQEKWNGTPPMVPPLPGPFSPEMQRPPIEPPPGVMQHQSTPGRLAP